MLASRTLLRAAQPAARRVAASSGSNAVGSVRNMSDEAEFGGRCPDNPGFSTACIYAGQQPDPVHGARTPPINMSTGFVFKDTDDAAAKFNLAAFGPIYSRIGNPTIDAVEAKIAALEGGMAALGVSSGHAAQALAFSNLLQPGDNFVSTKQLYGGSVTQFSRQFKQFGWEVRFVDSHDFDAMEASIDSNTKAIYAECIANPGGLVVDIERAADIAHRHGLPLVVDNTSATPYLVRPFEHGADIIVHSATKFLCGHGNALGGFIVEKGDFDWGAEKGKFPILSEPCDSYHGMNIYETFGKDGPVAEMFGTQGSTGLSFAIAARALGLRDLGCSMAPMNAHTISMGIETLPLRMDRHVSNANAVAQHLNSHPKVTGVAYAGLPDNPTHELAKKYCPKGAGALMTFSVAGFEEAQKVVNSLKMISLVANLGDVRTLVAHPASMMHRQMTPEAQREAGVEPETIRLSIGIEDPEDIISDLDQALASI